jgi:hypothetical protein
VDRKRLQPARSPAFISKFVSKIETCVGELTCGSRSADFILTMACGPLVPSGYRWHDNRGANVGASGEAG